MAETRAKLKISKTLSKCAKTTVKKNAKMKNLSSSNSMKPAREVHNTNTTSCNLNSNIQCSSNTGCAVDIASEEQPAIIKKQLELNKEIQSILLENRELKSKLSSYKKKEAVMVITFNDSKQFELHKDKLVAFLESSPNCSVILKEQDLLIQVVEDLNLERCVGNVDIEQEQESCSPKKKKKGSSSSISTGNDLFVLDTTPSITTKHDLFYESKFPILSDSKDINDEQNEVKCSTILACFNCSENHNLRDCPAPKNYNKINAARQKLKTKTTRYHLEDDQRFVHLQPGKISEQLMEALGLRPNQLPMHIYRMRQLGYPPGWFNEINEIEQSELVLFDFQGKNSVNHRGKAQAIISEKIVEYHGFNIPVEKGFLDECNGYGCPRYSNDFSKENMLAFVSGMRKKAEDNLENCDMEIDNTGSDKEVELINLPTAEPQVDNSDSISPTLRELESKKQILLAELTQDTSNSNASPLIEKVEVNVSVNDTFRTIDVTGTVDELNDIAEDNTDVNESKVCPPTPQAFLVKTSALGTPILKSTSPYCRLPNPDNFSINVTPIITFENLPNTTGNYDHMVGVLEKVRSTLKSLNDDKS